MTYTNKILKKLLNNKRASKGFSIGEMLVAVLILMLATQIIASAMNIASKHFFESTDESEAQLICATLSDFIRGEITTAGEIRLNGNKLDTFLDESGRVGGRCKFDVQSDGKLAMVNVSDSSKLYYPVKGKDGSYAGGRLKISNFSCETNDNGDSFTVNIEICKTNGGDAIAESNFVIIPFAGRPQ